MTDAAFLDGFLALPRLTPVTISQVMKPPAALCSQRYAGRSDTVLRGLLLLLGSRVVNAVGARDVIVAVWSNCSYCGRPGHRQSGHHPKGRVSDPSQAALSGSHD